MQTNPLVTKAATSFTGFVVGDTMAQAVAGGGLENYDWCDMLGPPVCRIALGCRIDCHEGTRSRHPMPSACDSVDPSTFNVACIGPSPYAPYIPPPLVTTSRAPSSAPTLL